MLIDDWIKVDDGGDISLAWDRMMLALRADSAKLGCRVEFAAKDYYTTRTLDVTRRVLISGQGHGGSLSNTKLRAHGCSGFRFWAGNDPTAPRYPDGDSQWSSLSDISVYHEGSFGDLSRHGVVVNAPVSLTNVQAQAFPGDGFHIEGDIATKKTSASLTRLYNCVAQSNGGRGFALLGGDASACSVVGCSSSENVGDYDGRNGAPLVGGFYDFGFLGNHFYACHSGHHPGSALAYLVTNPNARSELIGCYTETGNLVRLMSPSIGIGGNLPLTADSTGTVVSGSGGGLSILGKLALAGLGQLKAKLTLSPNNLDGIVAEITSALDTYGYSLFRETTGPGAGWWSIRQANTWARAVLALRADGGPNVKATPALWAPQGLRLGLAGQDRAVTFVTQMPTSGGAQGDVALNASAAEGAPIGWTCVAPGIWKPWAAVGAP